MSQLLQGEVAGQDRVRHVVVARVEDLKEGPILPIGFRPLADLVEHEKAWPSKAFEDLEFSALGPGCFVHPFRLVVDGPLPRRPG